MRLPAALTLQTRSVSRDLCQQRVGAWQVTLPIPTGLHGLPGLNDVQSRIPATCRRPMEAASGSVIPTKLRALDAITPGKDAAVPAKRHRSQQLTGGKNFGPPATLARNCAPGSFLCDPLDA